MSRKKVKKDVVKRKTNIYDPMGVYGRGLTESQRLGMTRQMKVENIREQEPVITREMLEKYQKLLTYYGIYTVIPYGNIQCIPMSFQFTDLYQIDNTIITVNLANMGIPYKFFVCDSFAISRPEETTSWNNSLWYMVFLGSSSMLVDATLMNTSISDHDTSVTVPRYFKIGNDVNYFKLHFDLDLSDMFIQQEIYNFSEYEHHEDFDALPGDGTPVPYLLYPNTAFPSMFFQVGMQAHGEDVYTVTAYVTVMY